MGTGQSEGHIQWLAIVEVEFHKGLCLHGLDNNLSVALEISLYVWLFKDLLSWGYYGHWQNIMPQWETRLITGCEEGKNAGSKNTEHLQEI